MSKYCIAALDLSEENEEEDFLEALDSVENALIEELEFSECTPEGKVLPFGMYIREAKDGEKAADVRKRIEEIGEQLNVSFEAITVLMTDDVSVLSSEDCSDEKE